MINKLLRNSYIFLFIILFPALVSAQDNQENKLLLDFISNFISNHKTLTVPKDSLNKIVSDIYSDMINNTETLNKTLYTYVIDNSSISFLKDLNLKFKTFNFKDDSNKTALGLSYSYNKDIQRHLINQDSSGSTGISFTFGAEGNVAMDKDINPDNFLDTKLSFHYFLSQGGTIKTDESTAILLNNLEDEAAKITDKQTLTISPFWLQFRTLINQNLSTQFYYDFSLNASLESNQDFSKKQYVYGTQFGFDLKAWNPNSTLANLNIFDWPFSIIRVFTGCDKNISPRGSTIPTILAGVDLINPQNDPIRAEIEALKTYPRFRFESSFKTQISNSSWFTANFRYYKEINAPKVVSNANIDEFIYFTSAFTLSNGLYFSYTTGKLPFDMKNEQVYSLGFQYKFN
ncbi:MAG: hypothetical protein P4L35_11590 [Ignavibacteriaceae bacterium]|nr:hypothetical protein [Ignavibacteriaceae bacterium]